METFPTTPKPTIPADVDRLPDIFTTQLGRGYKTDIVLSPNAFKAYNLRWSNYRPEQIDTLTAFLDRHYGTKAFKWTTPDGDTGLYKCRAWRTSLGLGLVSLAATFEEVNY